MGFCFLRKLFILVDIVGTCCGTLLTLVLKVEHSTTIGNRLRSDLNAVIIAIVVDVNTLHVVYIDATNIPSAHQRNDALHRLLQRVEEWSRWDQVNLWVIFHLKIALLHLIDVGCLHI